MKALAVGLIGAGRIAAAHLRAWARVPGFEVRGVFDLDPALAAARARAFSVASVYQSADQLISACDVVDVCTPPQTHADLAEQVIEAGKHLLVEKPVVLQVAEWERLSGLLRESPVRFAVLHNLKFAASVEVCRRWVDEGRIGRPLHLRRDFLTHPESDRMLGARHWCHDLPGGRWFETLPHELYLIHHFLGPLDLASVSAVKSGQAPDAAAEEVLACFQGGGTLATIHYSARCRLNRRTLCLYGSEGIIEVDLLADAVWLSRRADQRSQRALGGGLLEGARLLTRWFPDRTRYVRRRLMSDTPHRRAIRSFARFVTGDGPSPSPLEEVDYVVRTCELVGRGIENSLERGKRA